MAATSHDATYFHQLPGDPNTKIDRTPEIDPNGKYLKKLDDPSGFIYPYQEALANEPGMVSCDHLGRQTEPWTPRMPHIPGADGQQANAVLGQMTNMMNEMRRQMAEMAKEQAQLHAQLRMAQDQISNRKSDVPSPVALSHVDGPPVDIPAVTPEPAQEDEYFKPPEEDLAMPEVTKSADGVVQVGNVPDLSQARPQQEGLLGIDMEVGKKIEAMRKEFHAVAYGDFQRQADQKKALNRFMQTWFGDEYRGRVKFNASVTVIVQQIDGLIKEREARLRPTAG